MHNRDSRNPQHVNGTFCASSFVVGQHVVCMADVSAHSQAADLARFVGLVTWPKVNTVYTIRSIDPSMSDNVPVLLLAEIRNKTKFYKGKDREPAFPVNYFRPLQKLKLEDFMPIVEKLTDRVSA